MKVRIFKFNTGNSLREQLKIAGKLVGVEPAMPAILYDNLTTRKQQNPAGPFGFNTWAKTSIDNFLFLMKKIHPDYFPEALSKDWLGSFWFPWLGWGILLKRDPNGIKKFIAWGVSNADVQKWIDNKEAKFSG